MDKVVRDGKVAVVYSPGYGAGWSTWSSNASPFDPTVVAWILAGKDPQTQPYIGSASPYPGGLMNAEIAWLPIGKRFEIHEYDGYESVRILTPEDGYIA